MNKHTLSSFEKLIDTNGTPIFAYFSAKWCTPCQAVIPSINLLEQEFHNKLHVIKIDIDQHPDIAEKYDVKFVPILILFYKGEVLWRKAGAPQYSSIKEQIEKRLP